MALKEYPRDIDPPPGWKPKSDYFKSLVAKAEYARKHPQFTIQCPCCHQHMVTIELNFPDDK